ncbi:MAG: ribosome maturation factor RimM [Bacilli bacterium]|jgi:16S rRNA processing protein RimM|nr:ribosome maturation factor RimM [Bacilli bacterium]
MTYILIGKITNTHGIKGELKILSDFKFIKAVLKPGAKIYVGDSKETKEIIRYRPHNNEHLVTFLNEEDINQVINYKNQAVYIKRTDLCLPKGQYLDSDLIGLKVYANNQYLGIIEAIRSIPGNPIIEIVTHDQKKVLMPYHQDFIVRLDLTKKIIEIKTIKGLIE